MLRRFVLLLLWIGCAAVSLRAQSAIPSDELMDTVSVHPPPDSFPLPTAFVLLTKEPEVQNLVEVMQVAGMPPKVMGGYEGQRVILRVLFDAQGNYVRHIVLKDPYPALTQLAESVAPLLLASPAEIEGEPVAAWGNVSLFGGKLLK